MKKPELLAPAGSYEGFLGAVHAGADAVYLGGKRFGARAYAENFSEEEIRRAVFDAHFLHRKVYLTVNTLFRDAELTELEAYLGPLYEAGLDGVIVQDMGVFSFCRRTFPGLALHVSTQLSVTGSKGAAFLKEAGAARIVPARELSLTELARIRQEVEIELETFIHGALCYSYSGQCLFSSMLGGRSGNRGRCAQPCRLPYQILGGQENRLGKEKAGKESYPLSLKDLCVVDFLPELIEAGIDSFKIEGRMKSPEYTAGVTAIYRKYIDLYEQCGGRTAQYQVADEDRDRLSALYIRSQVQSGYYHRHNGKEMVTLEKPGYSTGGEAFLESVRRQYLERPLQAEAEGQAIFRPGEPARLTVKWDGISVEAAGEVVQEAQKQPLTDEVIEKQLRKTGQERFSFRSLEVDHAGNCFLPVKALNALRREAFAALEAAAEASFCRPPSGCDLESGSESGKKGVRNEAAKRPEVLPRRPRLYVSILQQEQIRALRSDTVRPDRIYLSADCLEERFRTKGGSPSEAEAVCLPAELDSYLAEFPETELFLALPYGLRGQDCVYLDGWEALLRQKTVKGLLLRNLEEYAWAQEKRLREAGKQLVLDNGMYLWNRESCAFWNGLTDGWTAPLELNEREIGALPSDGREWMIYGRIPMMITANCLKKTAGACERRWEEEAFRAAHARLDLQLSDRYRVHFPVYRNCRFCMNVIYNSVPLSLHQAAGEGRFAQEDAVRLEFTSEGPEEAASVLNWFGKALTGQVTETFPLFEFTTGHFRKGAQ